jgi:hypothetical protein
MINNKLHLFDSIPGNMTCLQMADFQPHCIKTRQVTFLGLCQVNTFPPFNTVG